MSHSFSADLRGRVITVISEGLSTRKAAKRFGIGISTAGAWFRRYRDNGELTARKQGQPSGSKLDEHEAFILGLVEETPDISLAEIAERVGLARQVSACPAKRFGTSSTSAASRLKKDCACERAATQRRESRARSLVRGATRPRPRETHLH